MNRVPIKQGRLKASLWKVFSSTRAILDHGLPVGQRIPPFDRLVLTVYFTIRSLREKDIGTRAASTTYTFVFSLVPLLTTTIAFLTSLPGLQDQRADLEAALFEFFVSDAARSVQSYIDEFAEKAAAAGAVSSLVFFVTTLFLLRSVEQAFNYVWHVREDRTWGQRVQVLAVAFVVGSVAVLGLVSLTGFAQTLLEGDTTLKDAAPALLLRGASLVTAWAVFTLGNAALPNAQVKLKSALVGGIVAGTAWHYLKDVFTWYVGNFTSYQNIYGALGTVPVFLLWVYLSFFILFVGAELAYIHQHVRGLVERERLRHGRHLPLAYFAVGIAIVLAQAYAQRKISPKLTIPQLAKRLSAMPLIVEESLGPLVECGLVLEVPEESGPVYLLGLPADQITLGEVARTVVGDNLDIPDDPENNPIHTGIAAAFREAQKVRNLALDSSTIGDLASRCLNPDGDAVGAEIEVEDWEARSADAPAQERP